VKKLFGTDGIRGVAGQFPLDYSSIYTLGKSLIALLKEEGFEAKVIIGRDTRESGRWIEQALFQGIEEWQGEAISSGVIPTSAVSYLTKKYQFSAGIVISASHNPYQDNGIKIFSSQGLKISDEWEGKLEEAIGSSKENPKRKKVKVKSAPSLAEVYMDFLRSQLSEAKLKRKIKIILDCSNGASSSVAPKVFEDLGFKVKVLSNSPSGKNINDCCGSLYPQNLAREVMDAQADIGIAYDGDADRAIWVDEKGRILNGDHTLFVQSRFMKNDGRLKSNTVVATTMSNIGLEKALWKMGIKFVRTQVGDRYVLEKMMELGSNLGGEQSGHTIFLDDCPTGDGLLTSLKMLEVMGLSAEPLSKMVIDFEEFPQILANVKVKEKIDFNEFPEIINITEEIRKHLRNEGRLEVRYSGTEPLARVMIEGKDRNQIEHYARRLTEVIAKYLGK